VITGLKVEKKRERDSRFRTGREEKKRKRRTESEKKAGPRFNFRISISESTTESAQGFLKIQIESPNQNQVKKSRNLLLSYA